MSFPDRRPLLREIFQAAVRAASPAAGIAAHLPERPPGRVIVVGAGKASGQMAVAFERLWGDQVEGLVAVPDGEGSRTLHVELRESDHPEPGRRSVEVARDIRELLSSAGPHDLVVALISGGGSALMTLPPRGVPLSDVAALTRGLLGSSTPIKDLNLVRGQLCDLKFGGLAAAAAPARVVTYVVSDIPGDDPRVIASGPTFPSPSRARDALKVIRRSGIQPPTSIQAYLRSEARSVSSPRAPSGEYHLVARPQDALEAAATVAARAGYTPLILSDSIEGESREVAHVLAAIARQVRAHGQPATAPCALISGGETTVEVRGNGLGGPNAEWALALALELPSNAGFWALGADTDGVDGAAPVAGSLVAPDTLVRAREAGVDPADHLVRNDAHSFFATLGDQLVTGPTGTNVNDLRCLLIEDTELLDRG